MSLPLDDRLIDRLVDGELPNVERRQLLFQLETEPDGWRRCALAFLEAQGWRATFAPVATPACGVARPVVVQAGPGGQPNRWRAVARLTALAAGIVVAFALGWVFHSGPAENAPSAPVAGVQPLTPAGPSATSPTAPEDHAEGPSPPSEPGEPTALIDPVVKQWEQQGYQAERQDRHVSVEMKDGRRVDVPVHEVRLRYVGGRTY
jgi:hypothetical protein